MQHIGSHLNLPKKRSRMTERGEMMRYFKDELNKTRKRDNLELITMPRMGKILEGIPTSDLYYLKSVCDEALRKNGHDAFSKRFWWELDPEKHEETKSKSVKRNKPSTKRRK